MPTFTHDMHTCFPSGAEEAFGHHLRDKPALFLEIGTFEGQSACWLLDNILTHPNSHYTGIECHVGRFNTTYDNLKGFPKEKWSLRNGMSDSILKMLQKVKYQFDGIYVDGDHREEEVYKDAIHSFHLITPGGVILFDDYTLKESSIDPNEKFNVEGAVQRALTDVASCSNLMGQIAKNGYQYIVRKLACPTTPVSSTQSFRSSRRNPIG